MAVISVPSSIQGQSYTVRIAGDAPTPEEQARIDAYVAQMDSRLAPQQQPVAPAEEPGIISEIGSGLGRGFLGSLAAIPGGLGALAEAGYGKLTGQPTTPGSTAFGGVLQDISQEAQAGVEGMFGPAAETTSGKIGEAIGSIGSFLIPGGVAGAGARLLGAGARAAGLAATGAGAVTGASLGAGQQAQDIGDAILNGDIIDPDAQQAAILWGGLIGTSEVVAGGAVSKLLGTTYKILNKVPPSMKEEAIATIGGRIRSAVATGGIEGAQEAMSQIAQNLVAREYYDEERALTEGAGESFGLGGVAGAAIDLALTSARAPAVRRSIQARKDEEEATALAEIDEDQQEDAKRILDQIGFGKAAEREATTPPAPKVEEPTISGLLPAPTREAPAAPAEASGAAIPQPIPQAEGRRPSAIPGGTMPTPTRVASPEPRLAGVAPAAGVGVPAAPTAAQRPAPAVSAPVARAPFKWREYTTVMQNIAKTGDASIPSIQKAASSDPKKPVAPAVAKQIRSQLVADGVLKQDKKAKGGFRYTQVQPAFSQEESYLRTMQDLQADIEDANTAREKALQDARRAEQTGTKASARKFLLAADEAQNAATRAQQSLLEVQSRLPTAAREAAVPRIEQPSSRIAEGKAVTPIAEVPEIAQPAIIAQRADRLRTAAQYYENRAREQRAQVRQLTEASRKVQLPKSEQKRLADLQREMKQNLDAAAAIKAQAVRPPVEITESRAQQAAAIAKRASAQAERAARTPTYTAKQGELFTALRKRLDNLGLDDVKLVAERMIKPPKAADNVLVEGMMDVDSRNGNRIIALSMGVYDPKLSQQELFDSISEVMNHEVIHAIRSLGLFKDAEWKVLTDLAARQRYMRQKGGKVVERNYTYLQRARQMYPDQTPEVQVEEAVAEMFRDYASGRLKIGGRPRTLMERIKDFIRSIWKSHEDIGFTDADAIFDGVRFGKVGARQRLGAPAQESAARMSVAQSMQLPTGVAAEEEVRDPREIVMPVDPNAPVDEIKRQISAMTEENVPIIRTLLADIDRTFGTKSNDSVKDLDKVIQKATRPSILYKKPWHNVSHIRDTYRFQTQIDDIMQAPAIFQRLLDAGVTIVKIDTNKLFNPTEWGWRIIAFDLRMPNGQLVEYQLPLKEMLKQKKGIGHKIYEKWRSKSQAELLAEYDEYQKDMIESFEGYNEAFNASLERIGLTPQEAEEAWSRAESSLLEAARNSRSSSGEMTSSSVSGRDFQTPSSVRITPVPSSLTSQTRGVPSSISANGRFGISGTSPEMVSDKSIEDNLTPSQREAVRYSVARAVAGIVRSGEPNMRPIPAPVKSKEGSPTALYGSIFEGGRPIPVIFPEGNHSEENRAGHGMAHIVARNHHNELFENSKYGSVQKAIYDLLYKWGQQGHKNGDSVIAYPDGGNLVLEWRNDLPLRSLPLRLVLGRHNVNGADVYSVKTFFPIMPKAPRRYSMLSLSKELRDLTILDRYEADGNFRDDAPVNPRTGKRGYRSKEEAMVLLQQQRGNKVFDLNATSMDTIARLMAAEAEVAMASDRSAIGWYDAKMRAAKAVLSLMHPEIASDPNHDAAMDFATAVTSNGMAVVDNYRAADEQYRHWRRTGRFLDKGFGNQGQSMRSAFRFYNALKDRGMSDTDIANYLNQDTTVKALKDDPILQELGMTVGGQEAVNTKVKVSFIIGPKIGQGFYQNLRGNFDPLTMDRWWMRMFNRLSGHPFKKVPQKTIDSGVSRVIAAITNPTTDYERRVIETAMESVGVDVVTPQTAVDLAVEINRIFQKDFKSSYDRVMKRLKDEGVNIKTDAARAQASAARPAKTELFKAADRLSQNVVPQLEESPTGGRHRQYMRDATTKARGILKDALGLDINAADFQALMWYAEKRLWDSLGIRKGQGEDNDYVDGAIALLRNNGYRDEQIVQALPAAERYRIDPVRYPRGQDGDVRGQPAEEGASGSLRYSVRRANAADAAVAARRLGRGVADGRVWSVSREGRGGSQNDLIHSVSEDARAIYNDAGIETPDVVELPKGGDSARRFAEAIQAGKDSHGTGGQTVYVYPVDEYEDMRLFLTEDEKAGFALKDKGDGVVDIVSVFNSADGPKKASYPIMRLAVELGGNTLDAFDTFLPRIYSANGFRVASRLKWNDEFAPEGWDYEAASEFNGGRPDVVFMYYDPMRTSTYKAGSGEGDVVDDYDVAVDMQKAAALNPSSARRMSVRYAASAITPSVQRKVQSNQKTLMYARSADLIARILGTGGIIKKDDAKRFADGLLRRFQDSMLPVGRMVQELSSRGMTITDAMDPYLQEELMHGVVGQRIGENQKVLYTPVVEAIKKLNVPKSRIDQLVSISDAAAKGRGYVGLALEQSDSPRTVLADAYLYARHAKERNRYIRANKDKENFSGSGMSDAEADAILQWFEGLDPANIKAIQDVARGVRSIIADTNAVRVDAGLISPDVEDPYRFYVPLRGITNEDSNVGDEEFTGVPGTPRFGARGREDRKALGRYEYASDIVANIFTQNQNAILRGERNKVGQSVLELFRADPAATKPYGEILKKAPTIRASVDGKIRDVPDPRAYNDPDILVVKENGKETYIRFTDERIAGALNGKNGMSPTNGNAVLSAMQTLNRYLASINTSYNPEFFITNMFRDLQTAGVNINQYEMEGLTGDVMSNLKSALAGIKRVIRNEDGTSDWSKVYKDFMAAGGQNATNQFNSLAEEMANIKTLLGDISESGARGQWAKVKNSFVGRGAGSLLQLIEDYNTVVENGIRVAAYKALLDRGFSRERAAQAARNVTVNFAKGGDYRQFMNAWSLFYNASLQGSFAMLNAAVRSSKVRRIWAGVMVAGLLQDQLNALLSDEDEDGKKVYDKVPDYILEHNFILPDPFGLTDRSYISIPMPYGLNMAHNIGRAVSRTMRGEYDPAQATSTIVGTIVDTINPIGGSESWANFFAPTIADPFVDILENEDFADKPIYKEGLPFDRTPAPDSQLYWATTSPSAVWLAKTLNELTGGNEVRPGFVDWSPDILEYWFNFATGGVGRFIQNTVESPVTAFQEGFSEELMRSVPFVRKLIGSVSEREDMGTYMEGAKSILTVGEELKRARETGDTQWVQDIMRENGDKVRLIGPIKSIESGLREVSKMRNKITASTQIPEAQKQVLLDRLDARKQALLQRANVLLRQAGV